ncbi:tyrosine-type recombinase/integrase [endosymbiont GvMRE of Glomus versiforme]|uniref:tyrosine-type recombinase/integrase n=1 Tax=endosymbiont GvMRE of Glomus versiforme TaxID=2039283 RepID=UPI000EDE8E7B|nr:tyrosine-type recombinase/integrase [endosymbiont GvMRE of Glomus versiforme]RHZ36230.1 Tyrosine recombinase XerD [endosymbiont GvMRE of Glomus versiforme]
MKTKKPLTILPTNQLLNQIWDYLLTRPNKKGETKKAEHECLFLLCWKAGLRISEAISFDLNLEHGETEYKGLYLLRGKRQKERWVYISPEIVKELKKRGWKSQQVNRVSFFDFLQQVKKELNIPERTELVPHTLRRCFATYNALNGMPLPVTMKKLPRE